MVVNSVFFFGRGSPVFLLPLGPWISDYYYMATDRIQADVHCHVTCDEWCSFGARFIALLVFLTVAINGAGAGPRHLRAIADYRKVERKRKLPFLLRIGSCPLVQISSGNQLQAFLSVFAVFFGGIIYTSSPYRMPDGDIIYQHISSLSSGSSKCLITFPRYRGLG